MNYFLEVSIASRTILSMHFMKFNFEMASLADPSFCGPPSNVLSAMEILTVKEYIR